MQEDYLAKRKLKKGTAGWLLLAGLGVSYVISGDFAGWNIGLEKAGWLGFVIAAIVMGAMYLFLVLSLAEMSAMIPAAGGGYSFARQVMGPVGGFLTGFAILIEYAIAPAAIVIFIGNATNELIGINGSFVYAAFYTTFLAIHLFGAGEALKTMMVISTLAVFAIIATGVALIADFNVENLFDIAPYTKAQESSKFIPFGWYGIWSALPFAMWLFLAIEGVPLAAEEAKNAAKDVPRGIIGAMLFLLITAAIVIVLPAGASGAKILSKSKVPLVDALQAVENNRLAVVVNILALAGLIASFFSIIFGYSRLVFALSRAGYLPQFLSLTSKRKTPTWALLVPGVLGFMASLTGKGDLMLAMAVVGATISYAFMSLSHILLRVKHAKMKRPYKTPGGVFTSGLALLLSLIALTGVYAYDPRAFNYTLILYAMGTAYYLLYSRRHLVAKTAEEEFAMIEQAEKELENDSIA